jgi:hypothetical protein
MQLTSKLSRLPAGAKYFRLVWVGVAKVKLSHFSRHLASLTSCNLSQIGVSFLGFSVPREFPGNWVSYFLGKLAGNPGNWILLNKITKKINFLEQFFLNCLNFKHSCFKCDANDILGDCFTSHYNLAQIFHISDFLVFSLIY